jgi:hypothetical protein
MYFHKNIIGELKTIILPKIAYTYEVDTILCCRSWKAMLVYCIGSVRKETSEIVVLAIS